MSTQSVLRLVNAVAEEAHRAVAGTTDDAIHRQAAFVRALVDEVERVHPADRRITALHAQLAEELAALAQLLQAGSQASPGLDPGRAPGDAVIDVLAVDDDEDARRAIAATLRHLGYPCRTARSAEEALREQERRAASIVLSDWKMPGMSGLDLCRELKRREPWPYVILVTGFHEDAMLLEGVRGGVDDFLEKPIDMDELEARLAAASDLVRAYRALGERSERTAVPAAPRVPAPPNGGGASASSTARSGPGGAWESTSVTPGAPVTSST